MAIHFYLFKTKNAPCNWSYDVTLRVTLRANLGKIFPNFQGISWQFFCLQMKTFLQKAHTKINITLITAKKHLNLQDEKALFFKSILILLFFIPIPFTYSIQDDSKTNSNNLPRSHKHKTKFVKKKITNNINSKYSQIKTSHVLDRLDSSVTKSRIQKDNLSHSEFVLFVGHGNKSGFYTDDGKFLSAGNKKFGNSTYWVIFVMPALS